MCKKDNQPKAKRGRKICQRQRSGLMQRGMLYSAQQQGKSEFIRGGTLHGRNNVSFCRTDIHCYLAVDEDHGMETAGMDSVEKRNCITLDVYQFRSHDPFCVFPASIGKRSCTAADF